MVLSYNGLLLCLRSFHGSRYHPKDLTHIAECHGGKSPRQAIYHVIDGGNWLPGHHSFNSPMPLWGLNFSLKGKEYSNESEAAVTRRINALHDYQNRSGKNRRANAAPTRRARSLSPPRICVAQWIRYQCFVVTSDHVAVGAGEHIFLRPASAR